MGATKGYHADFSADRRATAVRYLKAEVPKRPALSEEALLLLTVGLLICDSRGFIPKDAVAGAMRDKSVLSAAREVLRKAGL
jgi:hypothetical protein